MELESDRKFRLYAEWLYVRIDKLLTTKGAAFQNFRVEPYILVKRKLAQFTQAATYAFTLSFDARGARQSLEVKITHDHETRPVLTVSGTFTDTVRIPATFDAEKDFAAMVSELETAIQGLLNAKTPP